MVDFKEAKETRLNQLRGEKEREEQSKLGKRTRVFSNDNVDAKLSRKSDLDAFFRRLSKENLQKPRPGALNQKSTKDSDREVQSARQSAFRSSKQAKALTNELYKEHFEREQRRLEAAQAQMTSVKNVRINLQSSKEILAKKICA